MAGASLAHGFARLHTPSAILSKALRDCWFLVQLSSDSRRGWRKLDHKGDSDLTLARMILSPSGLSITVKSQLS